MVIVWSFLSGLVLVYGVPYFFGGLKGNKHDTPLGSDSAQANVVWGWLVFMVGSIFLHLAHNHMHPVRGTVFFAVGGLVTALLLADHWPKHAATKPKK